MNKWFVAIGPAYDVDNLSMLEPIFTSDSIYYADPFLLDGYLFFEEYDHRKGVISVMDLNTREIERVLEEPHHLSYPCVFKHDGEYYMLPEAGLSGEMWIYKASDFPFGWKKTHLVLTGKGWADPQILHHKDKWYIFYTQDGDNELRVLWANILGGLWFPFYSEHKVNSRSAGNIYIRNDKLIRPVQNCEKLYGGGIILRELNITKTAIQETEVGRIEATWHPNLIGTHTFNFDEHHVVIDGKIKL